MKAVLSILFMINNIQSFSQNNILCGIVKIINSNKTPLRYAYVTSEGANPKSTLDNGFFRLIYTNKKPGDIVRLCISKKGYEVVNEDDLTTKLGSAVNDTIKIFMCKAGERDRKFVELYNINLKKINEGYEKKLLNLMKENKATKEILLNLSIEKDIAIEEAKKLSSFFSVLNFDECEEMQKKAFSFFKEGAIDSAINSLNDAAIGKQLELAEMEERQSDSLASVAIYKKENANLLKKKSINNFLLKASLCLQDFRFIEARYYYVKALKIDTLYYESLKALANYYQKRSDVDSAIFWNLRAFSQSPTVKETISSLNVLGTLYEEVFDLQSSYDCYKQSLQLAFMYTKKYPTIYEPLLATIFNNLGSYFEEKKMFDSSKFFYDQSLEIYNKHDSILNKMDERLLPGILNNLASLYSKYYKYKEAEEVYLKGIDLIVKIKVNNIDNQQELSILYNNLSRLYENQAKIKLAKSAALSAYKLCEGLIKIDSFNYAYDYSIACFNLMIINMHDTAYTAAENYAIQALKVLKDNNNNYRPSLYQLRSLIFWNLSALYNRQSRYEFSKDALIEQLVIEEDLISLHYSTQVSKARLYSFLAYTYSKLGEMDSSNAFCNRSIKIIEDTIFIKTESLNNENEIAEIYYILGLVKTYSQDHEKAFVFFHDAKEIYELEKLNNPIQYKNVEYSYYGLLIEIANSYLYLSNSSSKLKNDVLNMLDSAESYFRNYLMKNHDSPYFIQEIEKDIKRIEKIRIKLN